MIVADWGRSTRGAGYATEYGQPSGASPAEIRACANEVVDKVRGFADQATGPALAVQPEIENLIKAYEGVAAG
jgi:hypothetical protein